LAAHAYDDGERERDYAAAMHRTALAALILLAAPALAQQEEDRPVRTRIMLGPQLVPSYPGADDHALRPYGLALIRSDRFQMGPSLGFEGKRDASNVGAAVPTVGFTFEAGAFAQYQLIPAIRVRAELRKGIGGHKGLIGSVGADYVTRDRDRWLFSIGPRVTLADARYHRAYFGVTPATAAATALPAFRPDGGVQAVGVTAGTLYQFSPRWGVAGYAKYDRLVAEPARSPLVRSFGSRDQLSGGIALSYTFGR
jgi:outer membrane scaffolding protein for murein synthesis (MipA/OmpV family)